MTTVEILREARGLIDTPEKWDQKGWGVKGKCCAGGALGLATSGYTMASSDDAYIALAQAIRPRKRRRTFGEAEGVVWNWNDAERRTHAEVMAAFDRAIAAEEAK